MRKPSRSLQLVTLVATLGLLMATGCVRGKSKAAKAEADGAAESAKTPREGQGPKGATEDWVKGILPKAEMAGTPKDGGQVTVQLYSSPPSLNTLVDSDLWASWIVDNNVYDTLARPNPYDDPDYRFEPDLATSWDVSKDGLTYTFHLRHGVKWQDGQPFTADDVIATFDKVMDPTTKSVFVRSYLTELKSYKKLDKYTVQFVWKKKYFMAMDAMQVDIQPAHIIAKLTGRQYNQAATDSLNRHPLGTGPFKFVKWDTNEKIVLARNPYYWGKRPHLDRLVFRMAKDLTVAKQLAIKGELDLVTRVSFHDWVSMKDPVLVHDFYRSRFIPSGYAWIGWNEHTPFFKDVRVRRAMTMLTDRKGIINDIMYGLPKETNCIFYYRSKDCDQSLKPLPFDPDKAVKLLAEAGWTDHDGDGIIDKNGVPFSFKFMIPASSENAKRMATKMKEDFKRAGIELRVELVEWSAFTKRLLKHDFDACTLLWGGGPRTDPTQIWASDSAKGGSNYIFFANKKADALMKEARVTLDPAKRHELYRALGKILYEQQPYTFLWVQPQLEMVRKRVHGAKETLYGWQWRDFWVDDAKPAAKTAAATTAPKPASN